MISVHVHDDAPDDAIAEAVDVVFTEIERLEQIFSTFRTDSELSRVNRGELHVLDAGPEIAEVLDACTWLEHQSRGAFTVRRPDAPERLDLAGFAKGWITERAAGALAAHGLAHWYVGAGGDVITCGTPEEGRPWRVGVAHPLQPGATVAMLELSGGAVATSGTAERGAHLWDGRSGGAAVALASMTVVGPDLAWADAFATTAFVMGADGVDWVRTLQGYEALAVTLEGKLLRTPGWSEA
jgi:FAD:protein FMN transferase